MTRIAEQRKLGRRLVRGYPVLEAEVVYAVHNEYCETPEDFIARRSRLAFLDVRACAEALPRVRLVLPAILRCSASASLACSICVSYVGQCNVILYCGQQLLHICSWR